MKILLLVWVAEEKKKRREKRKRKKKDGRIRKSIKCANKQTHLSTY
jgi:hypothetical protein